MTAESGRYLSLLQTAEDDSAGAADTRMPPSVERIIESLLFAGGTPLTFENANRAIRDLRPETFQSAIDSLARQYRRQNRPYVLRQLSTGWVLSLKPAYQSLRERLFGGPRETRLSAPALEVLAVVAYRQPIGRGDIDSLRGHDSVALLRQLVRLGLIAVQPRSRGQKETTYATTARFLEVFGLKSLDELPQTTDLQKI